MEIIRLVRAIAADLRAKDYAKAVQDFIALLQLFAGTPGLAPAAAEGHKMMATPVVAFANADEAADALEAFCDEHEAAGGKVGANGAFLKALFELAMKFLPLLLSKGA